jgi:uncharacterized protein YjbI with pentapeptide repeats
MTDDSDRRVTSEERASKAEETTPKTKAEDNVWYLLATLHGVPGKCEEGLREKNRIAWNRCFAKCIDDATRDRLIRENHHPPEELTPYSAEEWQEFAVAIAERCKASAQEPAHVADAIINNVAIQFSNVEFQQDASFKQYLFSRHTVFRDVAFLRSADFVGATFLKGANFGRAAFSGNGNFRGAMFSNHAFFNSAKFLSEASFSCAIFSRASFNGAKFFRAAYFDLATFDYEGGFRGTSFSGIATFGGVTFSGDADFDDTSFSRSAHFGKSTVKEKSKGTYFGGKTSFVNAKMKGETSFEGATFGREPPRFLGAKLYQGTVWRGIKSWPLPKDKKEAGGFIDAYACLKLEMDRLKKHEDELDFFAREKQSHRALLGTWKGLPIAIYGALSDYGRSYLWPLAWLAVVVVIGAWPIWYFDADRTYWEALGLSATNTLSVFGFRKDFDLAIVTPLTGLIVLAALQTILGAILLFLFGLGIRNKFRMK